MHFDDLNWERRRYWRWGAYCQSKLADLLFVRELQRRADEAGAHLLAAAGHPGYAATNLTQPGVGGMNTVFGVGVRLADRILGQSDVMGALPQLYAATMPDVPPGSYWGPDGLFEQRGHPRPVGRTKRAADDADARRLWGVSEELTGVTYSWS
jgi:NAD(P)-dependent dehydrogenase (short-subunit alcohol dehydrogenase family)